MVVVPKPITPRVCRFILSLSCLKVLKVGCENEWGFSCRSHFLCSCRHNHKVLLFWGCLVAPGWGWAGVVGLIKVLKG